jgi:hypothetical protein
MKYIIAIIFAGSSPSTTVDEEEPKAVRRSNSMKNTSFAYAEGCFGGLVFPYDGSGYRLLIGGLPQG